MRLEVMRLRPGDDLRASLEDVTIERDIAAGFIVSAVGSLGRAVLRYAGRSDGSEIEGPLEIVCLSGTLCRDGCHLHAAVADEHGKVFGGHVLLGCVVRTTAEVVIGSTTCLRFTREYDPATGFRELVVGKRGGDGS